MRFFRPFLPLFAAIFCALLGVGAMLATLPFYVLDELGGGAVAVGVVTATIAAAAVLGRPIAGRLADRHGYQQVMLAGTGLCAAAGGLYLVAAAVPALVGVRVLHGAGEAAVYTAGAAWLVAISPAERRGRVVGLYGIAMWLGITLGALVGAVLRETLGFGAVWTFALLVPVAGAVLVLTKQRPAQPPAAARPAVLPRTAIRPGIALSLASLGYAALAAFVAVHLAAKGIGTGVAAFNAFGVSYVGVRLLLGNWPDRLGAARVAFWSGLVEAAGLLLVGIAPNLAVAMLGGLVMGAGLSLLFPALALIVINQTEQAQRGSALGTFTSFWDLGVAAGGPIAGLVASVADYPSAYYVMIAAAVGSALLGGRPTRHRRAPVVVGLPEPPAATAPS